MCTLENSTEEPVAVCDASGNKIQIRRNERFLLVGVCWLRSAHFIRSDAVHNALLSMTATVTTNVRKPRTIMILSHFLQHFVNLLGGGKLSCRYCFTVPFSCCCCCCSFCSCSISVINHESRPPRQDRFAINKPISWC